MLKFLPVMVMFLPVTIMSLQLEADYQPIIMNIMQRQKHEENRHGDQENLLVVAGTRRAQW